MKSIRIKLLFIAIIFVTANLFTDCKSSKEKQSRQNQHATSSEEKNGDDSIISLDLNTFLQAALNGELDKVKRAVNSGINVDTINTDHRTALMFASFNGHHDVAKFLINQGADVNAADANHRTPLMFAASGPYPETVELLINSGSKLDVQDNIEGFTALMYAAAEGQTEIVKKLIDAGATVSIKDEDGETARDFALNNEHKEIAQILSE